MSVQLCKADLGLGVEGGLQDIRRNYMGQEVF